MKRYARMFILMICMLLLSVVAQARVKYEGHVRVMELKDVPEDIREILQDEADSLYHDETVKAYITEVLMCDVKDLWTYGEETKIFINHDRRVSLESNELGIAFGSASDKPFNPVITDSSEFVNNMHQYTVQVARRDLLLEGLTHSIAGRHFLPTGYAGVVWAKYVLPPHMFNPMRKDVAYVPDIQIVEDRIIDRIKKVSARQDKMEARLQVDEDTLAAHNERLKNLEMLRIIQPKDLGGWISSNYQSVIVNGTAVGGYGLTFGGRFFDATGTVSIFEPREDQVTWVSLKNNSVVPRLNNPSANFSITGYWAPLQSIQLRGHYRDTRGHRVATEQLTAKRYGWRIQLGAMYGHVSHLTSNRFTNTMSYAGPAISLRLPYNCFAVELSGGAGYAWGNRTSLLASSSSQRIDTVVGNCSLGFSIGKF